MINIKETTTLAELIREGISFTLTFQGHPKPVVMPEGYDENGNKKPDKKFKKLEPEVHISDETFTNALKAYSAAEGPQAVIDLVGRIKSVAEVDQSRRVKIVDKIAEDLGND